jgi:hypothetical protein
MLTKFSEERTASKFGVDSENKGNTFLRNVGKYLLNYTTPHSEDSIFVMTAVGFSNLTNSDCGYYKMI